MLKNKGFVTSLVLIGVIGLSGTAGALVDLQWRPAQQTVNVGEPVVIGLYAVSDSSEDQLISAMDVIVRWDPAFLSGVSLGDPQPAWLTDGFFGSAPDEINQDLADGDVMYTAWANFGGSAAATPQGLLCVEFEFTALAPVESTTVYIDTAFGSSAETKVFDGTVPNHDIKGTLGTAQVTVVPEPASLSALMLGVAGMWIRKRRGP